MKWQDFRIRRAAGMYARAGFAPVLITVSIRLEPSRAIACGVLRIVPATSRGLVYGMNTTSKSESRDRLSGVSNVAQIASAGEIPKRGSSNRSCLR